ncbi:primase-associated protein [Saliphagus sp. LR7]|uniref:primase-associated protein n=1 Tax=Saliphagus sp. LR7 TaxID=2282654 RepID=UPI000DF7C141|nr:primase-associated protein [Saliphagus sp. LR7]
MVDPRENTRDAYLVAAIPTKYTDDEIIELFARGYERYVVDKTPDRETLLSDFERFGTGAFDKSKRERSLEYPFVDRPATLVLLATLSAVCVTEQPRFEDTPPRRNQVVQNIRELFATNLLALVHEYDDLTLYQEIAEVLYAKGPSQDGPHPGRVCTGVKPMPELDDAEEGGEEPAESESELYVEIPMAAASRTCLAREPTVATSHEETGEIRAQVKNNHLYVPLDHLHDTYRSYASTCFGRLLAVQEDELDESERKWLREHETAITERTDEAIERGQYEQVWNNWDRGEQVVRVIRNAVQASPQTTVGEFYTAQELYDTLDTYVPDNEGEQAQLRQFSNQRSVAKTLANYESHQSLTIDRSERINTYCIGHSGGGSRPLEITELEDLFELPCLAAMDERLHEEKPVRKDLFNFVRMVMWLPQYREKSIDEITDEIKDVFSRWPWFDPEITEYQIKYEARRGDRGIGPKGNIPLPMNCDNDDMQRYCIGQDQCPYSIYGSLPFPDEMYDQLEPTDSI